MLLKTAFISSIALKQQALYIRLVLSLIIMGLHTAHGLESANQLAIGQWRHHLPGNSLIALAETPDAMIGASRYGLVSYTHADNSLQKINKVNGMNDFGISAMAWSEEKSLLIIGYENGNLDIYDGNQFYNIPDISLAPVMGSKSIHRILPLGNRAYLATGFGIIELNLNNFLIQDTYYIGPGGASIRVSDLVFSGSHFYAATDQGIRFADAQATNLADFQNWHLAPAGSQPEASFRHLSWHNGSLLAAHDMAGGSRLLIYDGESWELFPAAGNPYTLPLRRLWTNGSYLMIAADSWVDQYDSQWQWVRRIDDYNSGTVRANDLLIDQRGMLWMADDYFGLAREHSPGGFDRMVISGPGSSGSFGLATAGDYTWVAPGAISPAGEYSWNQDGVFLLNEGRWHDFNRFVFPEMDKVRDIIHIALDPGNPARAWASAWDGGLLEFNRDGFVNLYDTTNSSLRLRAEHQDNLRVGGAAVDRDGNVWVSNSEVPRPLSVRKANGEWLSFSSAGVLAANQITGRIVIDTYNQKWMILPVGGGIYLFRENSLNNANDFQARKLSTAAGQGGLPGNNVSAIAVDQNGYVWVATDEGVVVFYSPQRAFSGEPFNAQQIIVEQDGFAGYLFGNETVNCITVDGSNKKWFGTARSGAFLLSADGRETIFHFTTRNSPLPSDHIRDISIDGQTGEVFFATDKGLVSFRGLATSGGRTHSEVYAFPNPVRPGYSGYIAIKGLVGNALVKITDINGQLVWETIAEGGQAVWNGQDLFGRRPGTGVYLVFSTNADGSETMVTKIMFIN